MSAQELPLFGESNEWVVVDLGDGGRARWKEEGDGIISLEVGGRKLPVTRESAGIRGNDRFLANGILNEKGHAVQARSLAFLARRVDGLLKWQARTDARLAKIEKKIGIHAPAKARSAREVDSTGASKRLKPSRYFNPFVVDWRGTKQFFQIPDWVARSPLTPISQIVYSRLLFPLAGPEGFCERFDKTLGVVFGLNCAALAKHLGKEKPDYIERVVKNLCDMANPCIELHGAQGQTKTVRYLRTRWMSRDWLRLCKVTPDKKSEAGKATSGKSAEAGSGLPTNCRKFPLTKRILPNESQQNESPSREAPPPSTATPPRRAAETRARSSGDDSIRRQIAESLGATAPASKFARDEESIADEVWSDLCNAVGLREMTANGAMWERRLRLTRRALALAVSDWKAKTPSEKQAGGGNAAAYITAVYEREKQRAA